MSLQIQIHEQLSEAVLETIVGLEEAIFEDPYSPEKIRREAQTKHNLRALIATFDGRAVGYKVGYKVGYERTSRMF